MIEIRECRLEDSIEVAKLFSDNTDYSWDYSYWLWCNSLLSDSFGAIGIVDGKIVAYYSVIESQLFHNDVELKTGLAVHAFVHPMYREVISILDITKYVYQMAQERKLDFIYGFPNKDFCIIQEKIERWRKVKKFKALTCSKYEYFIDRYNFTEIKSLYDVSEMFVGNKIDNYFTLKRDLSFFLKRYQFHPTKKYSYYHISNSGKSALVILKVYEENNIKRGHLVDFVNPQSMPEESIIAISSRILFEDLNVDLVVNWPINKRFYNLMLSKGFAEDGFETFFGFKIINNGLDEDLIRDLSQLDNWELKMGDSDVF